MNGGLYIDFYIYILRYIDISVLKEDEEMEILKSSWLFFQDQILGMQWLSNLIRDILERTGLDMDGRIGGSIHFFIYDITRV